MIVEAFLSSVVAGTPSAWHDYWYTPRSGDSGVTVENSIQVTAVLACVRVLAETMAQLPLHLMVTDGKTRRQAVEQPLYEVLHDRPNSWQTSFEFREMMQAHLALRGNAYALIVPGDRGAVDQLIPLHPDRMQVFLLDGSGLANRRLGYLYRDEQGKQYRLTQDEVFHLRGLSFNGFVGLSVIAAGRNAVELAQKADGYGIWFYRNSARPGGLLKFPPGVRLDEPDHDRLRKSWRAAHTGQDLFTVAILEEGAEWEQMGLSNEDAQWLESRRFQTVEIARLFGVPPHMIGSAIEHGHTYANVEQSSLDFIQHTVLPLVQRWEQAIGRDLITQVFSREGERTYAKFNLEGLLRADSKSRAIVYQMMLKNGVLSVNEVRELEDLNPVEGGDEHNISSNTPPPMIPGPGVEPDEENGTVHTMKVVGHLADGNVQMTDLLVSGLGMQAENWERLTDRSHDVGHAEGIVAADTEMLADEAATVAVDKEDVAKQLRSIKGDLKDMTLESETLAKRTEALGEVETTLHEQEAESQAQQVQIISRQAELDERETNIAQREQRALGAWLADAAERVAKTEVSALAARLKKAGDREKFDGWVAHHWGGKVHDYAVKTFSPILAAVDSPIDATALATMACEAAVTELTTKNPAEVLERWTTERAEDLAALLRGDLCDDKG